MKKIIVLILLPFLLSACSNYRDLNKLNIIEDMAIIKNKNKYTILLKEITKKNIEETSAYHYQYFIKSGKNINSILKKLRNYNNKTLYFKKLQAIIINDTSILDSIKLLKIKNNVKVYYAYNNINEILHFNEDYNYLYNLTSSNKNTLSYIFKNKSLDSYVLSYNNKKVIKKRVIRTLN